MKKIIAILVVMLAFGLNANAQQKTAAASKQQEKASIEAEVKSAALKDVEMMSKAITLSEQKRSDFTGLFETKHRYLKENPNFSQERKDALAKSIDAKIRASLDPDQVAKLEKQPGLMKKLTH